MIKKQYFIYEALAGFIIYPISIFSRRARREREEFIHLCALSALCEKQSYLAGKKNKPILNYFD